MLIINALGGGIIVAIKEHKWAEFFSPRNGRLSIKACDRCGVAKSIGTKKISCTPVSMEKKKSRLRGWSKRKPKIETSYKLAN